jgi:eukaryotic-like serine/threonine-protein kinase
MTIAHVGRYRVLARLGAGGMGEVYRAHDPQLQRDVAIKILPATSLTDPHSRARLLREARAAAALNHSAICTIHEVGEADGQVYIAMELVDGAPLDVVARGRHRVGADAVVQYGRQIADALAHAHGRHIVHRDLKSANVVVTSDGRIKVLDFGLAKRMADAAMAETAATPPTLTEAGTVVGTPAYMAPEQLRGESADARSDIWSLGVVLYEVAAGARPFGGPSTFALTAQILHDAPAPLPASVPAGLRMLIDRCLEKSPDRRYQTAAELRAALDAIAGESGGRLASVGYTLTRRRRAGVIAACVVVVAVAVGFTIERVRRIVGPPRVQALAVLPLENLSGDPAQEYFADGMTEVLSTDLARLGGLRRVTARGSVVRYKGTTKTFAEIASELKVDALVTGSVVREGSRISITAHLVDPKTGEQLWTNRYERELQDVLALRNEIVSAIVVEIRTRLSAGEQARLASAGPVNPEAFEAYLNGRFHWLKQTRQDYDVAERYFQTSLERDPNYALGYAGLATVWMMRGDAGFLPAAETLPKAIGYINRALALDDNLPDLHVALANIKAVDWDWRTAEREFARAIALNPNFADAHFFYADLLLATGRPDRAQSEMQRALELDPLNDFDWTYYAWHLNYRGRYEQAIPVLQRLLERGPNKTSNYLGLWGAYFRTGRYREAAAAAREYFRGAGDGEFVDLLGEGESGAAYRSGMRHTGDAMAERSATRHIPALRVARMYAHAGDSDAAIAWLERAFANHESPLLRLDVVWDWVDLRADPRFQDLRRRIGLP